MEDLKIVFASNLIRLRTDAGMTQAELAEKLNYSDKSVSKWERADAIPDVLVVKRIADLFGVTVDFLLQTHDHWNVTPADVKFNTNIVTTVALFGILTAAVIAFVILWLAGYAVWMVLLCAIPVSLITLLVLNSVWSKRRYNAWIVGGLVLSIFVVTYYALYLAGMNNPWELVFVAVLAEIIVFLSFRIRKKDKKLKRVSKTDEL